MPPSRALNQSTRVSISSPCCRGTTKVNCVCGTRTITARCTASSEGFPLASSCSRDVASNSNCNSSRCRCRCRSSTGWWAVQRLVPVWTSTRLISASSLPQQRAGQVPLCRDWKAPPLRIDGPLDPPSQSRTLLRSHRPPQWGLW